MSQSSTPDRSLVKAQFGANAQNYSTSQVHAKGASLARLVELVAPQSHWQVLDVATGAGHTALAFAPHVANVVATDVTPEMLTEVAKNVNAAGRLNVATASADAEALPFDAATFDLVTCRIAPHHFPDLPRFVSEVWRTLKPGGVFALVDNVAPDAHVLPGFDKSNLRDADQTYNAFEKVRDPSHHRALTTGEWLDLVADIGFAIRHTEHQPKAMLFNTWCRTMAVPKATVVQLRAMLDDAKPALKAFLKPEPKASLEANAAASNDGPDIGFTLTELILIGQKSASKPA